MVETQTGSNLSRGYAARIKNNAGDTPTCGCSLNESQESIDSLEIQVNSCGGTIQFNQRKYMPKKYLTPKELNDPKRLTGKVCLCSRRAVRWSQGYVCQRCWDMEGSRMVQKKSGRGDGWSDQQYSVSNRDLVEA